MHKYRRFDLTERGGIIYFYLKGYNTREIAELFNRNKYSVCELLRHYHFYPRNIPKPSIDIEKAIELYSEGKNLHNIAWSLGTDFYKVRRQLLNAGIQIRHPGEETRKRWLIKRGQVGRFRASTGYILVKKTGYPRANKLGYVFEHILVWEDTHKEKIPEGFVIHHLNGIRDDNRPENLIMLARKTHDRVKPKDTFIKELQKRIKSLENQLSWLKQPRLI